MVVAEDELDANMDRLLDESDLPFRLRLRNPVACRPVMMENDMFSFSAVWLLCCGWGAVD